MPNNLKNSLKALAPTLNPLAAFYDRPLIWLLPFYCLGVAGAWRSGGGEHFVALVLSALAGLVAVILARVRVRGWPKYAIIPLIFAVSALGWGLCARALSPPTGPDHLINFIEPDGSRQALILGGYVLEGSGGRPGRNYRLIIDAREIVKPGPEGPEFSRAVWGKARLSVGGDLTVETGDYVRLPVTLRKLSGFRNPGAHDFERYWGSQGIWVSGFVKSTALVTSWPSANQGGFLSTWRGRAEAFIRSQVPEPAAGLLASQLIGRRGAVAEKSEATYRALGLSHILSVSGLHLGLWYGLCFGLIRLILRRWWPGRRGRSNALAAGLALIPALFYAALVGSASPVIRAAVMIAVPVLAIAAARRSGPWNVLAAAWLLLLIWPARLFTASFQLSFVATAAMVAVFSRRPTLEESEAKPAPGFWSRPIDSALFRDLKCWLQSRISKKDSETSPDESRPRPSAQPQPFFRNALLASLAGSLGTAPLVALHFGRVPPIGILANLIFTALLSFFVLIPGLMSLAIQPLSPGLAAGLMAGAGHIQMAVLPLLDQLAQETGPGSLLPSPGPIFLLAWYLAGWIWLCWPRPWKKRLFAVTLILAFGLLPGLIKGTGQKDILRFTVLDVGQGTSIHLSLPDGQQMLVDGGGGYRFDPGENILTGYLLRQGLRRLDIVALTHPDQDHLQGLVTVSRNFRPREVWASPWPENYSSLYQEFLTVNEDSRRADLTRLYTGQHFGPAEVKLLWPPADYLWPDQSPGGDWSNDHSLVLKVSWGETAFLITGDIGPQVEKLLAEMYGDELRSTILMGPHHGGRRSLTPEFMAAVRPEWVVFSSGRHNSYGQPHSEAVERARRGGAEVWRTDQSGAAVFEVTLDGQGEPALDLKSVR